MRRKTEKTPSARLCLALVLAVTLTVAAALSVLTHGNFFGDMRFELFCESVGSRFLEEDNDGVTSVISSLNVVWHCGDVYVLGYGGEKMAALEMPTSEKRGTPNLDVKNLSTEQLEKELRNSAYHGDSAMHGGWQTEEKSLWCIYPCSSRVGFDIFADVGKKDLYILVPEKMQTFLQISAENIYFDGISATTVTLNISDGECRIDGLKVQNLNVTANGADFEMSNSELSALDVATYTGSVTLQNCKVEKTLKSHLMSSDVKITDCEIAEISGESFFGSLAVNGACSIEKLYFESLTGNITSDVKLPDNAEITLNLGKLQVNSD